MQSRSSPLNSRFTHSLIHSFTFLLCVFLLANENAFSQNQIPNQLPVIVGAERTDQYVSSLKNKNVALVVNQTSRIGNTHLIDTLTHLGISIKKIFAPEHGFRGNAGAGENVNDTIDEKTGIQIISLYGDHKKPTATDLAGIDEVIYDIQDVGVRFYTYISTLQYVMESCAQQKIELLILDRPDPNGFYVDGPVLEKNYSSFVGMTPIPVVYGMTPGEYAQMLNGEKWLEDSSVCSLKIISCENYDHNTLYSLPVNPSPNLRNMNAIYLYPSVCFFEGTIVSVGRGTDRPFELIGYPGFPNGKNSFTPKSSGGAKNPPYENQECSGFNLAIFKPGFFLENKRIMLSWLIEFYRSSDQEKFFTSYFDKLAGTDKLRKQIEENVPENLIRKSWEPELSQFKTIRKKYLLYPDFE